MKRIFILIIFLSVVFSVTAFFLKENRVNHTEVKLPNNPEPVATPTTSWLSSDGKATLTMEKKVDNNSLRYTLISSGNIIYEKTVPKLNQFLIPYNSWSPDNKYFFIKEVAQENNYFYVFSAINKLFPKDSKYIEISEVFSQKIQKYKLADVTGWAAPNLLLVNTNMDDGTVGPSFWFDITSQKFIQLSTRFN